MTETGTSAAQGVREASGNPVVSAWRWLRHYLPEGRGLPHEEWRIRHRAVVAFILAHAVGLTIFGLVQGWEPIYPLGEGILIAALGGVASMSQLSRKMRSGVAALACVMSSAVLVQFWGGVIEAHFHFFVVVALISLYQDWVPFSLAVGFVAIDHGVLGTIAPEWVYNHPAALADPWRWAIIHAVLVLAECAALVVVWRANEQARAETERVLRSTGEGLLGVDAQCNVTFANPAAVAMAGGSDRDILGKPLFMMLLGDDGRPLFSGPEILRQNPGAFSLEARLSRANGPPVPVEVLCTPVEGHGHAEGAVVAMRDLTDRLKAEKERQVAILQSRELEQLREVNSFKTRFMNMAAHELNTPLTPISVQLATMKRRATVPPMDASHINSVQLLDRNFKRLSALVQDLLDSTRLQTDRLPLRPQPFDLAALASEVADSFEPAFKETGVSLARDLPPRLLMTGDGRRLSQAINNLLGNALKFTPPGGRVRLTMSENDGVARVQVSDTGMGMDAKQISRLFNPFEQVHEGIVMTKGGSGLGLYISRGIIEMHGGRIWCTSDGPGNGTTFTFEVPVQGPPAAVSPDAAATAR